MLDNHDRDCTESADNRQEPKSQAPEAIQSVTGKKRSRVKPYHLSRILRQAIIDQFMACRSSEDTAESLGLPVRCVDDVLKYAALKRAIQMERGADLRPLVRKAGA